MNKEIVIGCDNAAVGLKNEIIKYIQAKGYQADDVGVASEGDQSSYPLIASEVCRRIIDSNYTKRGVLICGTGIGMAISANKFRGIYAAVIHDIFSAERACLSNRANVVTLGARVVAPQLALKLLQEWLSLEYKPGPSDDKLAAIVQIEAENFK